MRDITLAETIYPKFTTRAFATGVPTTLAGTPVISAYENDSLTQITAGITLGVDHDSVTGLNMVTVVATGANGFESGKEYHLVITTGTVGGVSVVGEVVGEFTIDSSAALKAVDLLNDVAATDIVSAGAITTSSGAVSNVTTVATTTTNTDMRGTDSAATAAALTTAQNDLDVITGADGVNLLSATQASIDAIEVDTNSLNDTKIPDTISLAAINAEADTALTDIGLDHLISAAVVGADVTDNSIVAKLVSASATADWDDFVNTTDALQAIRDRGDAAWITGAGGSDRLLMVDTTIATLASQTSFTLTAGSADDDAYNNCTIVIEDVSTSTQKAVGMVIDYTGATKTVTLKEALAFTVSTTDKVYILAENSLKSTTANRQLDVTATGAAGIDWGNVENPTTAVDLSGTDIQLCDTVTTNSDMRGTDSAATSAALTTAQNDLDIITGADGVNLLSATQASIDAIEIDTSTTIPGIIDDLAIKKNTAFSNFEFLMVLSSDDVSPATGKTVTGQRSIDGGAFASVSGTIAEVSNGIYQFDALAADTNGDVITWRFSNADCNDTFITFKTVQ